MNDDVYNETVRLIHEQIRCHQEQYQKAVAPLVEQLVRLESLRPPRPFLVRVDELGVLR